MESSGSRTSFLDICETNTVYLETISSSSDFEDLTDSPLDSAFPERTIVEQRKKGILYCCLCQEISNDSCWKNNHLVFDVSDVIHCALGSHVLLFYQSIKDLDSALDQRKKYREILNSVEASLRRLTTNVQEKKYENDLQISQLGATKNEIISRRDKFISDGSSSAADRDVLHNQIVDCTKTVVDSCANATQVYQLYSNLQQSYLKVTIDGPYGNLSSVQIESSIDGPINVFHVLDEGQHTEDDVRRVVAYALETSLSNKKRNKEVRRIYPTKSLMRHRIPFPAPRTLLGALESKSKITPSTRRPFDCRNNNSILSKLSIRRLSTDDETAYLTLENGNSPRILTENLTHPTPSTKLSLEPWKLTDQNTDKATNPLTGDALPQILPSSQTVSKLPVETKITGAVPKTNVNKEFRLSPSPDIAPNSLEFYEVPEGPKLSKTIISLDDAVLESRRFAADRIRTTVKNTCVWHPQNNWLATTSDGPDALIWMLPTQDEMEERKKIMNESRSVNNISDMLRRQNRRVALNHSDDAVFQMAWNLNGTLLVTGSKKGIIRFWSTECNLDPASPPEAETMVETHENEILVLKFNSSEKYLISGGMDSKILVWDMERLSLRQTLTCHSAPICDVDWKRNSNIFVSCAYNGCIFIHRVGYANPLRSISDYPRWIKSIRWNPKADVLAACSVDSTLQIWGDVLKISSDPQELTGHHRSVNAISWRPVSSGASATAIKKDCLNNKYLASGSDDGTVIMWHTISKTKIVFNSKSKSSVKCLCFSPNGKILAAGREDGHIDCWSAKKGKQIGFMKLSDTIYTIDWDVTGTQLAVAVGNFGAEYFDIAKLKKITHTV